MDKTKDRIHYLDIAKGIAMILVILGHTKKLIPTNVVWWLYTFHMPLFFMLSGMVLNIDKYNFKEFFWKKFKTLIISYICLSLIGWFWVMIVRNPADFINQKTLDKLIGIFLGKRGSKYYFSMWFLTALFISEILIYLYIKLTKNKKAFVILGFLISAIIGCLIISRIDKGFYWSLDLVPSAISFSMVGYLLKSYKEKITFNKLVYILLMFVFLGVNILVGYLNYRNNGRADLYELNIGNPIYYYISAISGSLFAIIVSKGIHKERVLEYIGRNSLIYYAYQKSLFITPLLVIVKTLSKHGGLYTNKNIQLLIVVVGTCIGLAIISETINKCFPFIIGKFNISDFINKKRYNNVELMEEKEYEKI